MAASKINPESTANPDTGLGAQAGSIGGRFINRDGSFNIQKNRGAALKTDQHLLSHAGALLATFYPGYCFVLHTG